MKLTLLTATGCPHVALLEERLAVALAGHPGAVLRRRPLAGALRVASASTVAAR